MTNCAPCVLFVSELGAGFGHARRLLPVAEVAVSEGCKPVFLVSNPTEVTLALNSKQFVIRECPVVLRPRPRQQGSVARSFADILGINGFDDLSYLQSAASAWDAIFKELRPAAIVCEFSPVLCLAALSTDIPVLVVGYGFVLPPPQLDNFPALRDGAPMYDERQLFVNVKAVARTRGNPFPGSLPSLFTGHEHFVTGLDILDPYRTQRLRAAVGPPGTMPHLAADTSTEEFFAYLLGDASCTTTVLKALAQSGLSGKAYVRRSTEAQRKVLEGSRVALLDRPAQMNQMLQQCRLIVHHASMFMTEESLMAGRQQLVVPLYLEHLLTARKLLQMGVARLCKASDSLETTKCTLLNAIADDDCARTARSIAKVLQSDEHNRLELPVRLWRSIRK